MVQDATRRAPIVQEHQPHRPEDQQVISFKRNRADVLLETSSNRPAAADYDFGDGPVPAAQHVNPDGSVGGWVADTAHVDPDAVVGPEAKVFGNARVFGGARVLERARVASNARIDSGAVVRDHARVEGNSTVIEAEIASHSLVTGNAHVTGGARIGGNATVAGDCRVVGPAIIDGRARLSGRSWVVGGEIGGSVSITGSASVQPGARLTDDVEVDSGVWDGRSRTGQPAASTPAAGAGRAGALAGRRAPAPGAFRPVGGLTHPRRHRRRRDPGTSGSRN